MKPCVKIQFSPLVLFIIVVFLQSCMRSEIASPSCRVNAKYASNQQGSGACIIRMNDKLLATQLNSGLYDLPTSDSISSNLAPSSAQCSAHQELWKQTGLNVEVEKVVGIQKDGTWLFSC